MGAGEDGKVGAEGPETADDQARVVDLRHRDHGEGRVSRAGLLQDPRVGSIAEEARHTPAAEVLDNVGIDFDDRVGNPERLQRLAHGTAHPPEPA